jgi:integrase
MRRNKSVDGPSKCLDAYGELHETVRRYVAALNVFFAPTSLRKGLGWRPFWRATTGDQPARRPGSQANPARARYIPLTTIRDVLDACPSIEWKLVVGLARLAGLRCPTEIGELTWADVNWEKGRLMVRAKKTEHHGADHAVRVVPICPELRILLTDAFEQAEPGARLIVPMASRMGVNLRTHLERIIA